MGRPKGSWTGTNNPRWKGGRRIAQGYVFVQHPGHPNANRSGYVREHVLVMSTHLGRALAANEVVHHKNGIRDDNRIDNLEVMTRSIHHSLHHRGVHKPASLRNLKPMTGAWQRAIWASGVKDHLRARARVCDFCHRPFVAQRLIGRPTHRHAFCNRQCYFAYRALHPTKAR